MCCRREEGLERITICRFVFISRSSVLERSSRAAVENGLLIRSEAEVGRLGVTSAHGQLEDRNFLECRVESRALTRAEFQTSTASQAGSSEQTRVRKTGRNVHKLLGVFSVGAVVPPAQDFVHQQRPDDKGALRQGGQTRQKQLAELRLAVDMGAEVG